MSLFLLPATVLLKTSLQIDHWIVIIVVVLCIRLEMGIYCLNVV